MVEEQLLSPGGSSEAPETAQEVHCSQTLSVSIRIQWECCELRMSSMGGHVAAAHGMGCLLKSCWPLFPSTSCQALADEFHVPVSRTHETPLCFCLQAAELEWTLQPQAALPSDRSHVLEGTARELCQQQDSCVHGEPA